MFLLVCVLTIFIRSVTTGHKAHPMQYMTSFDIYNYSYFSHRVLRTTSHVLSWWPQISLCLGNLGKQQREPNLRHKNLRLLISRIILVVLDPLVHHFLLWKPPKLTIFYTNMQNTENTTHNVNGALFPIHACSVFQNMTLFGNMILWILSNLVT